MIFLRNLAFDRADELLVDAVSLQLHPGQKIGLVGANGCGKSQVQALRRCQAELAQQLDAAETRWIELHEG